MKISGGLIQIPIVKKACLAKQECSTDAYSSLIVTIHYTLFDFVGHPIFQLESILMTITLNQTTRGQTLWRSLHLETDITTCSHNAEIDNSAFSDASIKIIPISLQYLYKKVTVTWLRCKHCMAIASSQAGQVLITFLQTKHAHKPVA